MFAVSVGYCTVVADPTPDAERGAPALNTAEHEGEGFCGFIANFCTGTVASGSRELGSGSGRVKLSRLVTNLFALRQVVKSKRGAIIHAHHAMATGHRGWLKKRSPAIHHSLQKRWFVLEPGAGVMLQYFADESSSTLKGAIPVNQLVAVRLSGTSIELDAGYRTYKLVAESAASAAEWKRAIEASSAAATAAGEPSLSVAASGTHRSEEASSAPAPSSPFGSGGKEKVEFPPGGADWPPATAQGAAGAAPAATSAAATVAAAGGSDDFVAPDGPRNGVLMQGYLMKSPPEWSVRRVAESSRLSKRWFSLTNRALRWYADESMSRPLSSLPLNMVTACEPKQGGKHDGKKFYINTDARQLKLVATDHK